MAKFLLALHLLDMGHARTIVVGSMDDTFHQAESAVVAQVLRRHCYNVSLEVMTHSESFRALLNGSWDMLPSVWLPSGHAGYLENVTRGRDYEILGTTSEEGVFFWAASAALSQTVKSIADLADPVKTDGMLLQIHGPTPDSGLSKASVKITEDLNRRRREANASAPQFQYVPDFDAFFDFLAKPSSDKYAVAFWVPNWLDATYLKTGQVVRLESGEFDQQFGLPNRAVTLATPAGIKKLDPEALLAVSRIFVGNAAVSSMDLRMRNAGLGPMEAAEEMMAQPEYAYWFGGLPCSGSPVDDEIFV